MTLSLPPNPQERSPRTPLAGDKVRPATRREFFRRLGQYGFAAGLVGLALGLMRKPASSSSLPSQSCVGDSVCRHCRQAKDCSLPAALSMRQALAKD